MPTYSFCTLSAGENHFGRLFCDGQLVWQSEPENSWWAAKRDPEGFAEWCVQARAHAQREQRKADQRAASVHSVHLVHSVHSLPAA